MQIFVLFNLLNHFSNLQSNLIIVPNKISSFLSLNSWTKFEVSIYEAWDISIFAEIKTSKTPELKETDLLV